MTKKPQNTKENKKKTLPKEAEPFKWKSGQSGNPGGRPKKKPITEMFERMLEDAASYDSIAGSMLKIFSERSGIAKVMLLKDMADRVEGKVVQPVEGDLNLHISLADRMAKAEEKLTNK